MTEPSELDSSSDGGSFASPQRPDAAQRNLALTVAYDGTDFRGLAESVGVRTVMGELRATLEQILQVELDLTAAGRTDAGVHGWGQVVTGMFPATLDRERLQRSVNRMCAPAIAIRDIEWVPDSFDARFSATSWHVPHELDVAAMNDAAEALIGQHDFSSFCRRPKVRDGDPDKSLVRILQVARWQRVPTHTGGDHGDSPLLRFDIAATSFCHQMVRSIVGTLVEVGRGRRSAESVEHTLDSMHRSSAGPVAPPTGLVLWHVSYDGERWDA